MIDDADTGLTEAEQHEVDDDKAGKAPGAAADTTKADKADAADVDDSADDAVVTEAPDAGTRALTDAADALTAAARAMTAAGKKDDAAKLDAVVDKEPNWDETSKQLKTKYDAGELDDSEYERQREELLEKKFEYRADRRATAKATQLIAQREQDNAQRSWDSAVKSFEGDVENAKLLSDPIRRGAFATAIEVVAKENPSANYSDILALTKTRILAAFGAPAAANADADRKKKVAEEQARRDKAAGKKPVDLSKVPNAGAAGEGADKYAELDGMDINDLENTLAHMKPDAARDYLERAPGGIRDNRE